MARIKLTSVKWNNDYTDVRMFTSEKEQADYFQLATFNDEEYKFNFGNGENTSIVINNTDVDFSSLLLKNYLIVKDDSSIFNNHCYFYFIIDVKYDTRNTQATLILQLDIYQTMLTAKFKLKAMPCLINRGFINRYIEDTTKANLQITKNQLIWNDEGLTNRDNFLYTRYYKVNNNNEPYNNWLMELPYFGGWALYIFDMDHVIGKFTTGIVTQIIASNVTMHYNSTGRNLLYLMMPVSTQSNIFNQVYNVVMKFKGSSSDTSSTQTYYLSANMFNQKMMNDNKDLLPYLLDVRFTSFNPLDFFFKYRKSSVNEKVSYDFNNQTMTIDCNALFNNISNAGNGLTLFNLDGSNLVAFAVSDVIASNALDDNNDLPFKYTQNFLFNYPQPSRASKDEDYLSTYDPLKDIKVNSQINKFTFSINTNDEYEIPPMFLVNQEKYQSLKVNIVNSFSPLQEELSMQVESPKYLIGTKYQISRSLDDFNYQFICNANTDLQLVNDQYQNFLNQNKSQLIANGIVKGLTIAGGVGMTILGAATLNPLMAMGGIGAATSGVTSEIMQGAKLNDRKNAPNTIGQSANSNTLNIIKKTLQPIIKQYTDLDSNIEQIATYLYYNGYKINIVDDPTKYMNTRHWFDYLNCNLQLFSIVDTTNKEYFISNRLKETIKSMFSNGVRIWHQELYSNINQQGNAYCNTEIDMSEDHL